MLIFNGRKFARNRAAMVDTLFQADGTASGTYKRTKNGIQLFNLQGELFAFIVDTPRQGQFIVAASRQHGRTWYMQALDEIGARYLGIETVSPSQEREIIRAALATVA